MFGASAPSTGHPPRRMPRKFVTDHMTLLQRPQLLGTDAAGNHIIWFGDECVVYAHSEGEGHLAAGDPAEHSVRACPPRRGLVSSGPPHPSPPMPCVPPGPHIDPPSSPPPALSANASQRPRSGGGTIARPLEQRAQYDRGRKGKQRPHVEGMSIRGRRLVRCYSRHRPRAPVSRPLWLMLRHPGREQRASSRTSDAAGLRVAAAPDRRLRRSFTVCHRIYRASAVLAAVGGPNSAPRHVIRG